MSLDDLQMEQEKKVWHPREWAAYTEASNIA